MVEKVANILVVDDDPILIQLVSLMLGKEGYAVHGATSGADALAILRYQPIDILITDYSMPEMNGVELTREARKMHPDLLIYILTAYAADYVERYGTVEGVEAVISKPLDYQPFLHNLKIALNTQKQYIESI
jgi:two-component system response regulator GlrR